MANDVDVPISDGRPDAAARMAGLAKMRAPFPANQISKLPKGTKDQNNCPPNEKKNCTICGGWHHPRIVHLDYVGHAAITDRLLDADPAWSWAPMSVTEQGLPRFDESGGLWIRLTVCGVTRLGYGHAAAKGHMDPGSREKEVIGDALRNACMRFGAALELWHKGELHAEEEPAPKPTSEPPPAMSDRSMVALSRFGELETESDVVAHLNWIRSNRKTFTDAGFADQVAKAAERARERLNRGDSYEGP